MHIIIKEIRHTSGKVSPHCLVAPSWLGNPAEVRRFWNAEELKYQLTFSPYSHDYPTLEMAQSQCPEDAVIVSELSRHDGAKKQLATYQRQFPTATHLICLRRRKDWVVYGRVG